MENIEKPEVWLRGPLPNVPPHLQPAAHALLQAQEEINKLGQNFPSDLLWIKPAGLASVGFHMQHLAGVLDRLLTYARGESLTDKQLEYLRSEGKAPFEGCSFDDLLQNLNKQFLIAITQIENTDSSTLLEVRMVGRAQVPSTHLGLLFHAAEHTMRHLGQLLVTLKFLEADIDKNSKS
ncbi:DinB family protein [Dyadobacter subterraneus]|uniref:DinB family protein n=1 Tax=Dyadobacter subterraneus TaxID=2773304 RepID=A0ABR9WCB2_9BACT|nr:DinB family protein [Dyadobacter subterraneus]MBE9463100.1 DinB family protein [Dyadobacter subterraneus]